MAAGRTLGHRRTDAIAQELAELTLPPSFRQLHRDGLEQYLGTSQGPGVDQRIEITGLRASERLR